MRFQLETQTGVLIKKAARLFEQIANRDLGELEVTYAQTTILIRLWEQDGQNQMELAKSASLKQPTVVRLLDRMERDELLTRVRNTEDRRVFNFFLTAKAKKACQKLEGFSRAMNEIATKGLTQKEVATFHHLIQKIIANLDTASSK